MTIHDEIDNYLAADLHNELSEEERNALHTHLVECADCRKLHQETKIMNKILEETLAHEKPDPTFEQRMLAGFRNRAPQPNGLMKSIVDLMRLRPVQITAVAALLLTLVGVGNWLTTPTFLGNEELAVQAVSDSGSLAGLRDRLGAEEMVANPKFRQALDAPPPSAPMSVDAQQAPESHEESMVAGRARPNDLAKPATPPMAGAKDEKKQPVEVERVIVTGSNVSTAEAVGSNPVLNLNRDLINKSGGRNTEANAPMAEGPEEERPTQTSSVAANRKLIRNATVEIEIISFDDAVQKITAIANEERGYVATSSSEKQANGKLQGQVIVKVLPENLDRFLQKIRGLGELKNQTLGTEDVTKEYLDTDARMKNARVMEQRLIDMLKTKTGKVADLLAVEKELGRVREDIEKMQGELKFWDSQVQFATVTIQLAEKDLEEPAAFLLKERAQLALYTAEVEKIYNDIKALASPKVQITNAQLDRDYSGRVSARMSMLIAPEESDAVIGRVKGFGRVENFQVQTERIAQGGNGMSENAKTKRDKVELNVTISRDEQEQAFQQTSLGIRTSDIDAKAKELRALTEKQSGRVRTSSFSRDPDGHEVANVSVRVPMKNYNVLMQSLNGLGKVENVSVQRQDRTGAQIDEANAPADISIVVYSQGNIVSQESGLIATLRRTLAQSAGAIMWSLRMIGVALAFLAPWAIALVAVIWIAKRIARARRSKP